MLAVWEPGDEAIAAPGGTAFKIPAGAKLHLKVDYKKKWQDEQRPKSDKSTIGLYLTDEPLSGKSIQSVAIDGRQGRRARRRAQLQRRAGDRRPRPGVPTVARSPYASVESTRWRRRARKVPLLKLRGARPEWPRRYWLADPVELPAGTKIEVTLEPGDPDSVR